MTMLAGVTKQQVPDLTELMEADERVTSALGEENNLIQLGREETVRFRAWDAIRQRNEPQP